MGAGDQLTPQPLAQEMATLILRSELCILEGAGHLPPLEKPEAVGAMRAF